MAVSPCCEDCHNFCSNERKRDERHRRRDSHHLSYRSRWILFSGNKWDSKPEDHKIPSVTERGLFSIQSRTKEKLFCLNCSVPQYQIFTPQQSVRAMPFPVGRCQGERQNQVMCVFLINIQYFHFSFKFFLYLAIMAIHLLFVCSKWYLLKFCVLVLTPLASLQDFNQFYKMLCFWSSDSFLQTSSQAELSQNLVVQKKRTSQLMLTQAAQWEEGKKLRVISVGEVANCFPIEAEMNLSCYMEKSRIWQFLIFRCWKYRRNWTHLQSPMVCEK